MCVPPEQKKLVSAVATHFWFSKTRLRIQAIKNDKKPNFTAKIKTLPIFAAP